MTLDNLIFITILLTICVPIISLNKCLPLENLGKEVSSQLYEISQEKRQTAAFHYADRNFSNKEIFPYRFLCPFVYAEILNDLAKNIEGGLNHWLKYFENKQKELNLPKMKTTCVKNVVDFGKKVTFQLIQAFEDANYPGQARLSIPSAQSKFKGLPSNKRKPAYVKLLKYMFELRAEHFPVRCLVPDDLYLIGSKDDKSYDIGIENPSAVSNAEFLIHPQFESFCYKHSLQKPDLKADPEITIDQVLESLESIVRQFECPKKNFSFNDSVQSDFFTCSYTQGYSEITLYDNFKEELTSLADTYQVNKEARKKLEI